MRLVKSHFYALKLAQLHTLTARVIERWWDKKIDEKVTFDYKNKVVRFLVKVQIAKEVYTKRRRL